MLKLWIDDTRPAPTGYAWCKSVNEAKRVIKFYAVQFGGLMNLVNDIELIDLDHDAGDYASDGGDYIKLLDWFEEIGYRPRAIHIHSMNPVGIANMRAIIIRNHWKEV